MADQSKKSWVQRTATNVAAAAAIAGPVSEADGAEPPAAPQAQVEMDPSLTLAQRLPPENAAGTVGIFAVAGASLAVASALRRRRRDDSDKGR